MAPPPPIFVITGQLAAGKSTVARALLERFPFGVHIDVDGIREMVASGFASPLAWTSETARQFELAIEASVALAGVYHRAGFAVAIEGGIDPVLVDRHLGAARLGQARIGVVLHPPLAVALQRNRERATKAFDPAILEGAMGDGRDRCRTGNRAEPRRLDDARQQRRAGSGHRRPRAGHATRRPLTIASGPGPGAV